VIELHFLRHAHAGDATGWDAPDALRPLSEKGERQADRLGRFLVRSGFVPDALITSPKVRAARTAEIIAVHLGVPVTADARLAGPFGLDELDAILADAGDPVRPVLVGHDPDFSELVALIIGADHLPLRKGALVRVDLERPPRPDGGTLRWLLPPDLVPDA
jgi:phosphohistidine phosphatase